MGHCKNNTHYLRRRHPADFLFGSPDYCQGRLFLAHQLFSTIKRHLITVTLHIHISPNQAIGERAITVQLETEIASS